MPLPTEHFDKLLAKRSQRKADELAALEREKAQNEKVHDSAKTLFDGIKEEFQSSAAYLRKNGFPAFTAFNEDNLTLELATADPALVDPADETKLASNPKAWALEVSIHTKTQKVRITQHAQADMRDRGHQGEMGFLDAITRKNEFCFAFLENFFKST